MKNASRIPFVVIFFIYYSLLPVCAQPSSTYSADTAKVYRLNELAYKYIRNADYTGARATVQEEIALSESITFTEGRNLGYEMMAYIYLIETKYVEALEVYFKLLAFPENQNKYDDIGRYYLSMGYTYFSVGLLDQALSYYKKIDDLQHETKLPLSLLANVGFYRALVYEKQNNYTAALESLTKILSIHQELKDDKSIGQTYRQIGKMHELLNQYREALTYYTKYIQLAQKIGDNYELAFGFHRLGLLYLKIKNTPKAQTYFLEELKISQGNNITAIEVIAHIELGKIALAQNQLQEALAYELTSEKLANQLNNREGLLEVAQLLSTIYEKMGDSKKALQQQKRYNALLITQQEERTRIAVLENQLKNNVQHYEIEREKALKEKQIWLYVKYASMGLGGLALIIGLLLFFTYRYRRISQHQNDTIHTLAHDLKNSAGNTVALMEFVKKGMGDEYLDIAMKQANKLFNAVNQILDVKAIEKRRFKVNRELFNVGESLLDQLIAYEKKAEEKRIVVEKDIPSELMFNSDKTIFMFVADNLLSNAIKYTRPGSKVVIKLWLVDDGLELIVHNTGSVIHKEDQKKLFKKFSKLSNRPTGANESSTGLGLYSVKCILKAIKSNIRCESNEITGTTFIVTFTT